MKISETIRPANHINDLHPEVVSAYKKNLEAEDNVGNHSYKVTKAAVTRTSNNLSNAIKKHYGNLDMQANIALRTKLQNMNKAGVNESLDTPYPYQWQKQDEDHYVAKADTPAGLMLIMFEWMQGDESWNIDFAVNGRMGKSGAGDEFSIFATVIAVIRDWVSKVDLSTVKLISFSADKSGDAGTSRTKLYTRFAKQMASQLGWRLEVNTRDTVDDFFKMHNPDVQVKEAVAGPKDCWDGYKKDGTKPGTGRNKGKRVNNCVKEEVEVSLHGDAKKGYVLSKIAVPSDERNSGQGTNAMQDIVDRMDAEGAIIALTPDDAFGGNKNRLIDFYKRFGFVPNKGRNKDFRFRETMIRYPQAATSVELEEDISVTDVAAMAAVAGLAAPVMASLIKGAYKTGKNLLQLKKIASKAGVKLADKLLGESNPFTDARMNAIKAGETEFVVKGKRYQVTGDTSDELNAVTESLDTTTRTDNIFQELNESRMWKQLKQLTGLKMSKVAELMFEQLLALQIFAKADPTYAAQQAAQIMRLQNFDGFRTSQPDLYNVLTIMCDPDRFADRIDQDVKVTVPELRLKRNLRAIAKDRFDNSDYGYMMLMLQREMQDFLPAPLVQLRRQVSNWDRTVANDKKVIADRLMLQMREHGFQNEYYEKLRILNIS